jgi:ectoine hydroxylase-related dioxygenase (phytanoyl-CoA dioxygenase family)
MSTICRPPRGEGWPIHLDTRYDVPGYAVGLGAIVLLDDFTEENGATRFLPSCDLTAEPTPEEFDARALALVAPAGSVCWFHGWAWHDAGPNLTDRWRRAVLFAMVRSWVAPRFDIPRMLADHSPEVSPVVRRRLGLDRLPPGSYEEFHQDPASRRSALLRRAGWQGPAVG